MVATPIGNLEDITYRAVKVLGSVDVIACEDTRHTMQLLSHYGIKKRLIACHAHNEVESAKGIIELLDSGLNVAYCSDAGTPGVSDPGARLCEAVRADGKHEIIPIPGASAFVSLVSVAGNIGKSFHCFFIRFSDVFLQRLNLFLPPPADLVVDRNKIQFSPTGKIFLF